MRSSSNTTTSSTLLSGLLDPENHEAWKELVDRYRPIIVGFAAKAGLRREDAEDVAQETLSSFAWAYREGRFDRTQGRLRSWLFGFAWNHVQKTQERTRQREARHTSLESGTGPSDVAVVPDPAEAVWEEEWRDTILRRCLEAVRREVHLTTYRAFEETALKERGVDEVAAELGLSVNAVRLAKSRTLARVRDIFPLFEEMY